MQTPNIVSQGKGWINTTYDDYGRPLIVGFGSSPGVPTENLISNSYDSEYIGQMHAQSVSILDGFDAGPMMTKDYDFDLIGRVSDLTITNLVTYNETYGYTYDRADNILTENHLSNGVTGNTVNTYDGLGRLDIVTLNGQQICNYAYTIKDEVDNKVLGSNLQTIDYTYLSNGWLQTINSPTSGSSNLLSCPSVSTNTNNSPLFSSSLSYNSGSTPQLNGNISAINWKVFGRDAIATDYTYDQLNRLTSSVSTQNIFNTSVTYKDHRGNIETLTREGLMSDGECYVQSTIDDLTYGYFPGTNKIMDISDAGANSTYCPENYYVAGPVEESGIWAADVELTSDAVIDNSMNSVFQAGENVRLDAGFKYGSDGSSTFLAQIGDCAGVDPNLAGGSTTQGAGFMGNGGTYAYDDNGNITLDPNKGFTFSYNHLNLPYEAVKDVDNKIEWAYTAEGERIQKKVTIGAALTTTKNYVGSIEFTNGQAEAIYHGDGRISYSGGQPEYQYYLKDHLGNTRIAFRQNGGGLEVIQESHYYPFGMELSGPWQVDPNSNNDYLYNGKELNKDLDLNLSLYGARFYDPSIARFTGVDPISDQIAHLSTYNYASNNPVTNIDLYGLQGVNSNGLSDFIDDAQENGFFSAVSNYFNIGSLFSGTNEEKSQTLSRVHGVSDASSEALDPITLSNEEIVEIAQATGASGEVVETVGDVTMLAGGIVTPFQPEVGIPMVEAGITISNAGVAMQVSSDVVQGDLNSAGRKVLIETIPGIATIPLRSAIDNMGNTSKVSKQILNHQVNTTELILEQAIYEKTKGGQ